MFVSDFSIEARHYTSDGRHDHSQFRRETLLKGDTDEELEPRPCPICRPLLSCFRTILTPPFLQKKLATSSKGERKLSDDSWVAYFFRSYPVADA